MIDLKLAVVSEETVSAVVAAAAAAVAAAAAAFVPAAELAAVVWGVAVAGFVVQMGTAEAQDPGPEWSTAH